MLLYVKCIWGVIDIRKNHIGYILIVILMIICFIERNDPAATPSSETKTKKIQTEKQSIPVVTVKLKDKDSEKTGDKNTKDNEKDTQLNEKDSIQKKEKETETAKENKDEKTDLKEEKDNSLPQLPNNYSVEYMEAIENEILRLCNVERAKVDAKPLEMNPTLREVARYKSNDMLQNNYFSHTSPFTGFAAHQLVNAFGYKWTTTGENIWMMSFSGNYKTKITAEKIFNDWMNSSGHKANILNKNFGRIGVGVTYSSSGKCHSTQVFSN